jgi:hypothetical protein
MTDPKMTEPRISYATAVARAIATQHTSFCNSHYIAHLGCPAGCGASLISVTGPGWMNEEQFDSVKLGDYFCDNPLCAGERHENGRVYWRKRQLAHKPCNCPLRDAAALRQLAANLERAIEINADLGQAEWPNEAAARAFELLSALSTGFHPPAADPQEGEGR